MDFAILVDHKVKIKENENIEQYLDLSKEQKICGTWGFLLLFPYLRAHQLS